MNQVHGRFSRAFWFYLAAILTLLAILTLHPRTPRMLLGTVAPRATAHAGAARPLSGRIREWAIPAPDALPHDPAVDPKGNVWLTLMSANKMARFNLVTRTWKLFPVLTENAGPHGLTADRAGNIWFTENRAGKIGKLDPATGKIVEFDTVPVTDPHTPIFTPDGALWFTAERSNAVSRLDPRTGKVQVHLVPTQLAVPYGIVLGADHALWFCEFGVNKLGRIDPVTGKITEFTVPEATARPRRLVAVGEAIYFTDFHGGRLGRFELGAKTFKMWPSPGGPQSAPYGIASDLAGNVWYEEFRGNNLIRFDPHTQKFSSFPMPSPRSGVRNMARDAEGRIWMALSGADKVAVVQ